jgi:predicted nucleotidyltransferase
MYLTPGQKADLKEQIRHCLCDESEVTKIILFGSFINSDDPHDIDVAVFQDSAQDYLSLALKYRKHIRPITQQIPVDIIPLKNQASDSVFMEEINAGEVIYER